MSRSSKHDDATTNPLYAVVVTPDGRVHIPSAAIEAANKDALDAARKRQESERKKALLHS